MREMTFWQLISAFRDEKDVLAQVLGSDRWRASYLEMYNQFDEAVRTNDRGALDALVPLELSRDVAMRSQKAKFLFYPNHGMLTVSAKPLLAGTEPQVLTALDVHDRFGGPAIEEALEFGSAPVGDVPQ